MRTSLLTRREFLTVAGATTLAVACVKRLPRRPKIGLALGGGGAKGIAHVLMLEVLDELGVHPHRITGTSVGAVFGVMYAAGMSSKSIHDLVDRLTVSGGETWSDALFDKSIWRWLEFLDPTVRRGGLIDAQPFLDFLHEAIQVSDFAELKIPFQVVATDFWTRQAVVFQSGELLPAIQASMAVPGLFPPVEYRGQVLVDGGLVDPLPYELLLHDCDLTIAIDVLGDRTPGDQSIPSTLEVIFNSFQIMEAAIMREKLRRERPDILIRPQIENVRVLEFFKTDEIFAQSRPAQAQLRRELQRWLR
ncbi:MAG: patatin-like phospholipase family protein [Nitrospirota bacterium]|jgi:NTE family protein